MRFSLLAGFDIHSCVLEENWDCIIFELQAFVKFFSLACLAKAGLPIMPLFLFKEWNSKVKSNLEMFIHQHDLKVVLVRSQKYGRVPGGRAFYNLPVDKIPAISKELFLNGAAIVGVQAPGDIYRNEHSVHIDIDLESSEVNLEIVGPGFTATHLSKWGLLHERYCLKGEQAIPIREYLISNLDYKRTVGYLLKRHSMDELTTSDSLLLDHLIEYESLSPQKYAYLKKNLNRMRDAIIYLNLQSRRGIVSMSWINERKKDIVKPYFWDIHEFC